MKMKAYTSRVHIHKCWGIYHIFLVIRQGFPFQNNPRDLDPSCKMDLDLLRLIWKRKTHFKDELHTTDLHICGNFGKYELPYFDQINKVSHC